MARIEFDDVAHSYSGRPQSEADYALKPIAHTWDDGGAYALLGPSGCGKTTLLNITSGLVTPSQGRVLFDGEDVTAMPPEKRNIAQVFQFPVLYDTMTVEENLAFPLRNRGAPKAHVRKRVRAVAEMLELEGMLGRKAANLGAEEKQKISMGRGLVRDDVAAILFDEPLTVIDPHMKWVLRRKLRQIHAEFGHTLIYVTHDQTEALTFADKVVVMDDGRLVQTGTPQELFENPAHTFVGYFIGSPGMNFLPCRIEGEAARVTPEVAIPLPETLARRAARLSGALELGIRPSRMEVAPTADEGHCTATAETVEDLGSYALCLVTIGSRRVRVRVPEGRRVQPGERLGLRFPQEWVRLYCDNELVE
ncbi:ABC transporter ATP-binding protein [Aquisalimonas lutea]|uniref:ABC transporter ATP-binding protein n=1 Tax=Aquisalimonas lutea TaxID=1327750 RepID=UPI0025B49BEA|nr:ABC transporter ATP-binding protein [Aquisalimonas lutea]MDN3516258.1 ABC transporter ATP-binding protein [Aquisalimonas lutea]